MRDVITVAAFGLVLGLGVLVEPAAAACPADSVQSGTVCMDKYEASVWYVQKTPINRILINRIRNGTVTLADMIAHGAVQLGLAAGDLAGAGCPATGNGCVDVYAVSIPGVTPAQFINWFQAAAAARNALKRLPTNQEWQVAALGTPDTGGADNGTTTCNTDLAPGVTPTGSRSGCISDVGAFDMVANVWEWVADWGEFGLSDCTLWSGAFGADVSCFGGGPGLALSNLPAGMIRGGFFGTGTHAGVFAVIAAGNPSDPGLGVGFRCAR